MRKLLPLLFLLLVLFSCKKKERICDCPVPYQIYYLKATVAQTQNTDCGKPLLDFTEDSAHLRMITGTTDVLYVITSLPASLNTINNKLYVNVASLKPAEDFACTTMGPAYPKLKLLDAKQR